MKIEMHTQNGKVDLPEDRLCYVVDIHGTVWIGHPIPTPEGWMPGAYVRVSSFWEDGEHFLLASTRDMSWTPEGLVYADILRAVDPTPGDFQFDQGGVLYFGIIPGRSD